MEKLKDNHMTDQRVKSAVLMFPLTTQTGSCCATQTAFLYSSQWQLGANKDSVNKNLGAFKSLEDAVTRVRRDVLNKQSNYLQNTVRSKTGHSSQIRKLRNRNGKTTHSSFFYFCILEKFLFTDDDMRSAENAV